MSAILLVAPSALGAVIAASNPPSPTGPVDNNGGAGAGSWGLLIVAVLIVVSIALFVAMNRSLKHARHNLGGDQLPRRPSKRPRPAIPLREDRPADSADVAQQPARAAGAPGGPPRPPAASGPAPGDGT